MIWRRRAGRTLPALTLAAVLTTGFVTSGCRTTKEDVHRWAQTKQGPRKLVAVLSHDKYEDELRVEAALTLAKMKPRNGQQVGIESLMQTLQELPAEPRRRIVKGLLPKLEEGMRKAPQAAQGSGAPLDDSYKYKDAAFAIMTAEKDLIEDQALRQSLEAAMVEWAMADFSNRLDNSSQMTGMETVLRKLGAQGVKGLPALMKPEARRIKNMAELVAELGDDATKDAASAALVTIAKEIDSDAWKKKKRPELDAINKANDLKVTESQLDAQVELYQQDELLRVFAAMKDVGRKPVVNYLLDYAQRDSSSADDDGRLEARRVQALAVLAGNIDKGDKQSVDVVLSLAVGDKTPDAVRQVALARVGDLPRELVAERLYDTFKHERWNIRWVGADLLLKMSKTEHLDEFMTKLGANHEGMSVSEPYLYGYLIGDMKGEPKPSALVDKYTAASYPAAVRVTALAYYMRHGTKDQLGKVTPFEEDRTKTPTCKESASDCEWVCVVGEGKDAQNKNVETVGDFVKYCVKPQMEKRTEADKKDDKQEGGSEK